MKRAFILFLMVLTIVVCAGKMAIADGITISVSSDQLLTHEHVTITVSDPNADALRLYESRDDRDEFVDEFVIEESESSELQYSHGFTFPTTAYYRAKARYNGVWSDAWSETKTVSFTAPYGNLERASLSYELSDDLLTVTVSPVANAERYAVSLWKGDSRLDYISRETAGDFEFHLEGDGDYSVSVSAIATGWDASYASIEIKPPVVIDDRISISASSNQLLTGELVTITVSDPNADALRLYEGFGKVYEYVLRESESSELQYSCLFISPGTVYFRAKARYDGVWSDAWSETQIVSFNAPYGNLESPSLSYEVSGALLTVTVSSVANAENYNISLTKDGSSLSYLNSDSAGNFEFHLEGDGNYSVSVLAYATGWDYSSAYIEIKPPVVIDDRISIDVSNTNIQLGDELTVSVTALDAEAVKIYMRYPFGYEDTWGEEEGAFASHTFIIDDTSGEYSFYAEALYNGEWKQGNSVTVTATSKQELAPPAFFCSDTIHAGETLVITVEAVPNAQEYWVTLFQDYQVVGEIITLTEPGEARITIDDPGDYLLQVTAMAPGYEQGGSSISIRVEPAQPTSGLCGENVTWSLADNGTLTISGTGDMFSYYDEQVPWDMSAVKKVVVESGVTRVGGCAFMNAYNLTEVQLPAGLKRIGQRAFSYCGNLKEISLPAGLESIGANAFAGSGLTEIDIPAGIENIGFGTFSFCDSLERVSLPASLTRIGQQAFMWCTSLPTIELPDGVTFIGANAFERCYSLYSAILPASITQIGENAFDGCFRLKLIVYPDSEGLAYANQQNIAYELIDNYIHCGENVTWSLSKAGTLTISGTGDMFSYYDEQVPWDMSAVKKVVVESGVTRVGGCAFMGASNLTEVQLPAGLKRIGQRAFSYCRKLTEIDLPAGLESIGANAFAGSGLTEIDIPAGIENIGFGTFSFCGSLARVSLPASLTRIGQNAFMVCSNLTTLVLPQGVRFIGENAFDYCDIVLYGYSGSPAANLGVPFFTLDQNILTLPANTTTIESEAFAGLGAAVIVEIPATVTTIAPDAFNDSTVAFRCAEGSLAADYAAEHSIPIVPD